MKKLLILFLPIILFAQRPEGFRGTNGISMVDIRIAIGDSNIVSLQGTTPDTAKIQGGYPLKLSGLRVTGNAKFESNVIMSTIAGEQIKAGAGTAALPQYSASADTNTGMYLDGADGLGLSTAGLNRLFITSAGKIGKGTLTPLTSFSLVDATSGQGTGIHVVSSQWNKARATWAAAHDTSSIMQYIDSAGGPRSSWKAVDGDSFAVHLDGSYALLKSNATMAIMGGSTTTIGVGTTYLASFVSSCFRPYASGFDLGASASANKWQDFYMSRTQYVGGKGSSPVIYVSGENTIAGTDSALVLSAASGVPTITAMHTGTFTNGGRRFYTGADTLLLVNGAKTGRDSTVYVLPNGSVQTSSYFYPGGATTTRFGPQEIWTSVSTGISVTATAGPVYLKPSASNGVGIGTSGIPGAKLEINGDKSADTLLIVRNDRIGAPYDSVFSILSNGNMGSNGVVTIKRSVQLADLAEYTPQIPAGMCGWGTVQCGDEQEWVRFRFKADGTVTLEANSTNVGTTNDTDTKMNIYDAGTGGIVIENQLGSTLKFAMTIECYTP